MHACSGKIHVIPLVEQRSGADLEVKYENAVIEDAQDFYQCAKNWGHEFNQLYFSAD